MQVKKIFISLSVAILAIIGFTIFVVNADEDEIALPGFDHISEFYASNRYTYPNDERTASSMIDFEFGEGEIIKIKTDLGEVAVDKKTLNFQVKSDDDYVWSSTIDYTDLTPAVKRQVASAVVINFVDTKNNFNRSDSYSFVDDTCEKTFQEIENGFESTLTFTRKQGREMVKLAKLKLKVTFTTDGINICIPSDSIEENDVIKIYSITPYPYLGAVESDKVPGYMLVPDGCGALIRYHKPYEIAPDYTNEIYGKNLSFESTSNLYTVKTNGASIYAPVFGIVHGVKQNSLFAIIESGQEYGTIRVKYPTETIPYSTVYTSYQYRRTYDQPMGKDVNNKIVLLQSNKNNYDIKYSYKLLLKNEADYVGMAKYYNQYLKNNGILHTKDKTDNISLKLETIGLEKTKGVLFDKSIVMTTFNQYQKYIETLNKKGIENIIGVFNGFTSNGVSWGAPKYTKISSKLGSKTDIINLNKIAKIYYSTDFQKASAKGNGYSAYSDLAKKINDQRFTYQNGDTEEYLLSPKKTKELFNESIKKLNKYNIDNYYLTNMGNLIYSDADSNMTIRDTIEYYHSMIQSKDKKIGLSRANDYMWDVIDDYFDFPLYSSQRLSIDDTVPFLSLVLQDSMNLYSTNANFFAYPRAELLRLIDFNIYPSFIVTNKSSQKLEKTNLNYIYSSKYDDLEDEILTYYNYVNDALKYVTSASLVERIIPKVGLVKNIYNNGTTIIINYTNSIEMVDGKQIQPMSYQVIVEGTL